MTNLQDILNAARNLPSGERAQLIYALWDTISPDEWAQPNAAWVAESQRRSEEIDAGRMSASSWSDVRTRSRRKAGLDD